MSERSGFCGESSAGCDGPVRPVVRRSTGAVVWLCTAHGGWPGPAGRFEAEDTRPLSADERRVLEVLES